MPGKRRGLHAGAEGRLHQPQLLLVAVLTPGLPARFAYLRDILERMVNGHPATRIDELLPWNWNPAVNP